MVIGESKGYTFRPQPKGEVRRRSIVRLLQIIISANDPIVLPEQKLQAIDTLLWKYTEADGKHNTPFRSLAAARIGDTKQVIHDHVSTRKTLKHRLLASSAKEIESLLQEAIGCIVTRDEHNRLSRFDRVASGWRRYELAGVDWVDLRNQTSVPLDLKT